MWVKVECAACLIIGIIFQLQLVCVLVHAHGATANSTECLYTVHIA